MLGYLLICVDANYEIVAQSLGLTQRVGMPKVNHVITVKISCFNVNLPDIYSTVGYKRLDICSYKMKLWYGNVSNVPHYRKQKLNLYVIYSWV